MNHNFKSQEEELLFYRKLLKSMNASIYIEGVDPYSVEWVAENDILDRVLGLPATDIIDSGAFASALIDNHDDFYEAIVLSTQGLLEDNGLKWAGVCRMKHAKGHSNWILFSTSSFETDDTDTCTKSVSVAISLQDLFKSKKTLIECIEDLKKSVYEDEYNSLTKRQMQVLKLIGKGLTQQQIAETLKISKYTVVDHRKAIYKKLDCKNERELLIKAAKCGMI